VFFRKEFVKLEIIEGYIIAATHRV